MKKFVAALAVLVLALAMVITVRTLRFVPYPAQATAHDTLPQPISVASTVPTSASACTSTRAAWRS